MAIEPNPANGDVTVTWPLRITLRQCPEHGLVEEEFLDGFTPEPGESDLCMVPTYQEEPCHDPLSEERIEYLHPMHIDVWRNALLSLVQEAENWAGANVLAENEVWLRAKALAEDQTERC